MTIESWAGLIVSLISIAASFGFVVRWLVKHYFDEMKAELKPNSGSSLKDQVTRLEREMQDADFKRREMSAKIDHMYDILIDYISKNSNSTNKTTSKRK